MKYTRTILKNTSYSDLLGFSSFFVAGGGKGSHEDCSDQISSPGGNTGYLCLLLWKTFHSPMGKYKFQIKWSQVHSWKGFKTKHKPWKLYSHLCFFLYKENPILYKARGLRIKDGFELLGVEYEGCSHWNGGKCRKGNQVVLLFACLLLLLGFNFLKMRWPYIDELLV